MSARREHRWLRYCIGSFLLCQIQAVAVLDRVLYGEWMGKPGDKLTQTIVIYQIAVSAVLFYQGSRRWRSVRKGALIWLFLAGFQLCTVAWSVNPGATIRGGVQYMSLIVAGIGVAETLEMDEFMDIVARVCFFSAIASLVLLAVWPAAASGGPGGDFRGVFPQKNPFGEAMAMGTLACLHGLWAKKRSWGFGIVMFLTLVFMTVLSKSATSLLNIVVFVGLGTAIHKLRMKALLAAVPLALIAIFARDFLIGMLGKDPTLTGRTDLWARVIPDIWQSPLLGWGYQAFWSTNNLAAVKISNALHWWVPQAHNGVLEILLSAGLVGAVVYIYLLARAFCLSILCMRTNRPSTGITCFLICVGIVVTGVSENVLIYPSAVTVVFIITTFFCERALREARWQRFYSPAHRLSVVPE